MGRGFTRRQVMTAATAVAFASFAGRPSRALTLARFLDYVASKPKVWVATREQIARHWMKVHPAA